MIKEKKIPYGYKASPFGPIPNEWRNCKVDYLVNEGILEKPLDGNHGNIHPTASDFVDIGIPFVMANCVHDGILDLTQCHYIKKEQADKLQKGFSKSGDLLFTHKGTVGNVAIVGHIETDYIMLTPQVTYYRVLDEKRLNKLYLKSFFESSQFQMLLKVLSGGGTRAYIGITNQRELPFLLPEISEQTAIANLLSTWDKAIQTTNTLIEQKQNRKKWLMKMLLTGKKRLKGFEKEKWKKYSYENVLKVVKRPIEMHDNELYRLISVRRRSGGIFAREPLLGKQILVKQLRTANEGDFLFSKMQILHGASALVTKEFAGYKISGSYIAAVAKDTNVLNLEFFEWYSRLPIFYHQTYISSYGVHIEKMTFDWDSFMGLGLKLPSAEEQKEIVNVLKTSAKEIKLLQTQLEQLKEQKKGLMQILLTGKKRLKVN